MELRSSPKREIAGSSPAGDTKYKRRIIMNICILMSNDTIITKNIISLCGISKRRIMAVVKVVVSNNRSDQNGMSEVIDTYGVDYRWLKNTSWGKRGENVDPIFEICEENNIDLVVCDGFPKDRLTKELKKKYWVLYTNENYERNIRDFERRNK